MTLLSIRDLTVKFPTRRRTFVAVNGATLTVEAGEIHGLVGESGAGKSTVGAAVMGLLEKPGRITEGRIDFKGDVISGIDAAAMRALRGKKISMIFQDPLTSLNPLFTVREQLTETILEHLNLTSDEADARALALLERVGIPHPKTRLDQYPHQFSGGMRQRVVIALALCSEPDVIIADEPTTALDVSVQAQILELIKELTRERQVGVILITHDMGVIAETTDNVTVMYHGEVVEHGPTPQVLGAPQHPYTQSLIAAVPRASRRLDRFPLVTYGDREDRFDIEELGRTWPKPNHDASKPLLSAKGLTKRFVLKNSILPWARESFAAVDDFSFDIWPGEVFGLVGESGSGKSTIGRMICGLHALDGGSLTYAGADLASAAARKETRGRIQMIFQDPYSSLNPMMRVDSIVAEPMWQLETVDRATVERRVGDLLERVGLGAEAGRRYPHEFSGGQRQRIAIARALATQPDFLICDEPTSALDVSTQAQILNLLKDLQEHLGLTMLFISHDLPVVRQMCDRVAVARHGKLVELQPTETLFEAPKDPYTRELLELMPRLDRVANDAAEVSAAE